MNMIFKIRVPPIIFFFFPKEIEYSFVFKRDELWISFNNQSVYICVQMQ